MYARTVLLVYIGGEKLIVNDKEIEFTGTIKELINRLGFTPEKIAILVNGELIKKELWEDFKLKENDYVEIVSLVGGG